MLRNRKIVLLHHSQSTSEILCSDPDPTLSPSRRQKKANNEDGKYNMVLKYVNIDAYT